MSHEYWFKVLDQDGDGIISIYDLHQFYIEQLIKLKSINIDPISFEDKLDDILDRLAAATNTDPTTLAKGIRLATLKAAKEVAQPILGTWVLCPVIAGLIAMGFFTLTKSFFSKRRLHILRLDAYTRTALLLAGAFGAYSLGANNIANVMGVFVPISPFTDISISSFFVFSSKEQLFLLGGIAIAVGVFTYSKRVMFTVGNDLLKMSPVAAFIVVISHSIVLFLFASQGISNFLQSINLPSIPLVPVSSSQAVVGAVIGIGLLKGGKEVKWSVAGKITIGWFTLPIIAAIISMILLYILSNFFNLSVFI